MPDLVFKNTPWGDFTIESGWPQWQKDMWLAALGSAQPEADQGTAFVPTFEEQHYSHVLDQEPVPLSIYDFATRATADEIAKRFDGTVNSVTLGWTESPQWWISFPDGTAVNAGVLAVYYLNNPEDKAPGVAKGMVERGIATARAAGQKLPA